MKRARTRLPAVMEGAQRLLGEIADRHHALNQRLAAAPKAWARLASEIRAERDALVHPGFVTATPWEQLAHLPRYLTALDRRLPSTPSAPTAMRATPSRSPNGGGASRSGGSADRAAGRVDGRLDDFRWLLEELRVSLFAQELKTPYPVSFKRVERAWADLSR